MYKNNAIDTILNNIPAFFIASFMGIGVNYMSYLVIQYTSSLTMKILGTVRNIILIFYGVLVHGEVGSFSYESSNVAIITESNCIDHYPKRISGLFCGIDGLRWL